LPFLDFDPDEVDLDPEESLDLGAVVDAASVFPRELAN
jgi:DNA primase